MIRPATSADLPAIRALQSCLTDPASDLFDDLPLGLTFVSVPTDRDGSMPVGYVHAFTGNPAYVSELAVAPAHRREGHGRRLLSHVLTRLERDGYPTATLTVATDNDGARQLYASLGFVVDEELPGFYDSGQDALRLRRG
ncbi:GNAT family N-acetyltransferase [Haloarchaeobius sp. DFWS5]|uniref:GNAT family N-acetyltransferase n=1 Tax=Haloarchaeobius sp. DFWS5 TaxID=3446114 RepID=UPI003EBAD357